LSTINLGKCVSQASKPKGEKFVWAVIAVLDNQVFRHEQQVESRKRELGARALMEGEFWCMLERFWCVLEQKIEKSGCQA
jgi:hypothetical protein